VASVLLSKIISSANRFVRNGLLVIFNSLGSTLNLKVKTPSDILMEQG